MKRLTEHIKDNLLNEKLIICHQPVDEKLLINKNFKNADSLEELFSNIDFKHDGRNMLKTSDDIFSIMADYIRDHNIRSFSNFDSYRETSKEDRRPYIAVFNKRIKEIDIFQKISNETYKVFIIFKLSNTDSYMFKEGERSLTSVHVLKNTDTWNNANEVEYYEISKETFDNVSELYNKL